MKGRAKVVALSVLIALVIAVLLSCGGQGTKGVNPSSPAADEPRHRETGHPATVEKQDKEEDRQEEQRHKIAAETKAMGEWFTLGGFRYRIMDVDGNTFIGNQVVNERADNGAVFVIVSYDIENLGNKTETVMTDGTTLLDSEGREFRPSSRANTALLMTSEHKRDFILSELQPGIVRKMRTAFELPQSSAQGLTLLVHEKGFFGTGKIRVALESKGAKEEAEQQLRLEASKKEEAEQRKLAAEAKAAKEQARLTFEREHPDEAAQKRFTGVLHNARALINAKIYTSAEKSLRRIIKEAPGTKIAAEAQHVLESMPNTP
jgi:hypothetical protein